MGGEDLNEDRDRGIEVEAAFIYKYMGKFSTIPTKSSKGWFSNFTITLMFICKNGQNGQENTEKKGIMKWNSYE